MAYEEERRRSNEEEAGREGSKVESGEWDGNRSGMRSIVEF